MNVADWPAPAVWLNGCNVITGWPMTARFAGREITPALAAVIDVVPAATPVAIPERLTVAAAKFEDVQVTFSVRI